MIYLKKIDWSVFALVLLLSSVGLITIYSIDQANDFIYFYKQLGFVVVGLILAIIFSFFDYRILKNNSIVLLLLYFICLLLLGFVLIFGKEVRGITGWLTLGMFRLQPVEITKLVLILILAKYFSQRHIEMYRIRHIIVSGVYVLLPTILIYFQPDLGSILVLICLWISMMLIAGIKFRHLFILGLVAILIFISCWFWLFKDYHRNRLISFLNPGQDPFGQGYNSVQSIIAVGSGGWSGVGFKNASQSQLNFLPEHHTDFIFATMAEEWGLAGVLVIMALYLLLFWRMLKIAFSVINNFSRLFISGLIILIFLQLTINIGMNLAILPVIGLTLPFISYGGSSLISLYIGFAIIESIKMRI